MPGQDEMGRDRTWHDITWRDRTGQKCIRPNELTTHGSQRNMTCKGKQKTKKRTYQRKILQYKIINHIYWWNSAKIFDMANCNLIFQFILKLTYLSFNCRCDNLLSASKSVLFLEKKVVSLSKFLVILRNSKPLHAATVWRCLPTD